MTLPLKPATTLPYATQEHRDRATFLNIYPALERDRLQVEIISHQGDTQRASCELPISAVKLLIHQVTSGGAQRPGWTQDHTGSSDRHGTTEQCTVRVAYDEGENGEHRKHPYRVIIMISQAATPGQCLAVRLSLGEMTALCLELRDELAEHQSGTLAYRRGDQQARYDDRQARQAEAPKAQVSRE